MRVKLVPWFLIVVVLAVLGGAGFFVWMFYYAHAVLGSEAYAVWQTADLIIAYMQQHGDAWPRSWDDLRPLAPGGRGDVYSAERDGVAEVGFRPPLDIDRLQEMVEVDWSADVVELARAPSREPEPPFRVVRLRSGRRTAFVGCEPNRLIKAYLDGRYQPQKP
jgi:hypothetical protein